MAPDRDVEVSNTVAGTRKRPHPRPNALPQPLVPPTRAELDEIHRRIESERCIRLDRVQALHEHVMRCAMLRLQGSLCILEGGTALAMLHGLDRHSIDLDLDAAKPVDIAKFMRHGLQDAGVALTSLNVTRSSEAGQRLKIHCADPYTNENRFLNVDLKFGSVRPGMEIVRIHSIRTYGVPTLFDQTLMNGDGFHNKRWMRWRSDGRLVTCSTSAS